MVRVGVSTSLSYLVPSVPVIEDTPTLLSSIVGRFSEPEMSAICTVEQTELIIGVVSVVKSLLRSLP